MHRFLFCRFKDLGMTLAVGVLLFSVAAMGQRPAVAPSKGNPSPATRSATTRQTAAQPNADGDDDVRQIEIIKADALEGFRLGNEQVRLLIGGVVLRQDAVTLTCDSALFYPDRNDVRAYGRVRINQADTIRADSDSLYFDGDAQLLRLMGSVRLSDRSAVLTTNDLDYNLGTRIGRYRNGGKLNNQGSVLTSQFGTYLSREQTAFFQDSVVLVHPNYSLFADTLEYRTDKDLAVFHGPTRILHENNTVYCEGGSYDGQQEVGIFTRNAVLDGPPQRISGDSIVYNSETGIGKAWGNVLFTDSEKNLVQRSQYSEYDETSRTMYSTGRSLLSYVLSGDSLHLSADHVRSKTDSLDRRELFAYGDVRLFKSDLQAVCDSMIWRDADSTISLFQDPVLWSDVSQFTADTILILIRGEEVHRVNLLQQAFIVNEPDSLLYNQIRGRLVTGYFKESELVRMDVRGNGESIYFADEEGKGYLGANKALCSNMVIRLVDQQVNRISFLEKTDAIFHDLKETDFRSLRLDGFSWRLRERPKSRLDLMTVRAAPEPEEETGQALEKSPGTEQQPAPAPAPGPEQQPAPSPAPPDAP
ncbi:MAG: hypothetical protein GC205_12340 [Bacteroidetes bacterium]|nr:hypothetical protein [Bacteroidota bacterium]